ncbi:unannotated protein [freshwater metagenome]|uniref:Unannotated protein n=1 Tax=freshwater metagenome TaxID=449393 RepID=A0A6J7E3E2_9ZZZZ
MCLSECFREDPFVAPREHEATGDSNTRHDDSHERRCEAEVEQRQEPIEPILLGECIHGRARCGEAGGATLNRSDLCVRCEYIEYTGKNRSAANCTGDCAVRIFRFFTERCCAFESDKTKDCEDDREHHSINRCATKAQLVHVDDVSALDENDDEDDDDHDDGQYLEGGRDACSDTNTRDRDPNCNCEQQGVKNDLTRNAVERRDTEAFQELGGEEPRTSE